jgi:hypothetical protein
MYEKCAVNDYVIDSTVNVGPSQGDDNSSDRLATKPGQNTYIRGRTNQLGNVAPTGILGNGSYRPNGAQVITSG